MIILLSIERSNMNIEDTIMSKKCKCEGCKYNEQTYGKRIWNCTHPIPCEKRLISENGCVEGETLEKQLTIQIQSKKASN